MTLGDFLDELFRATYKTKDCLVVGFNLPFDISRLGFDVTAARGMFSGGFSLGLWTYTDKNGNQKRNGFRPRVTIKHVDSKRSLMGFTARKSPDKSDLVTDPIQRLGELSEVISLTCAHLRLRLRIERIR